jgi:hypothetical protein
MSMYLFSTPVECTQCGTVVDDPTRDRCPTCSALLRERRTPSRLAGVEKRYGGVRLLAGFLRFLGIISALVGLLIFVFSVGEMSPVQGVLTLLAGVLAGVAMFAVAAFFEVILDMEENTRASFHIQQMMLEHLQRHDAPQMRAPADGPETSRR